jgi:cytochrome P450/NADPH-cytochrome P450 reductase
LPSGQEFVGCATGFMASMRPGKDFAYIHIKPSEFRLPKQVSTPMLMVGPGTGFAPFRGFLQERRFMVENQQGPLGAAHLFFGCRRRDCDWIYRSEMEGAKKDGLIDSLEVALSREKDTPKVYVQQRIAARAADIRDLLFNQVHILLILVVALCLNID